MIILATLLALGGFAGCAPKETEKPEATATQVSTATPTAASSPDETVPTPDTTPTAGAAPTATPSAAAISVPKATGIKSPGVVAGSTQKPVVVAEPTRRPASLAIWEEVVIKDGTTKANAIVDPFDLEEIKSQTSYIFSGTIVGRKEYVTTWMYDNGLMCPPESGVVLEVKISKDYYGKRPDKVADNIIHVFYPYSLAWAFDLSIRIKEGGEYVFVAREFTEEYLAWSAAYSPDYKAHPEDYAEVVIGNNWSKLLPIENGKVIVRRAYFEDEADVLKKTLPHTGVSTDKLSRPDALENGVYIVLSLEDFDKEFPKLFAGS